jgi:hypothetical protein
MAPSVNRIIKGELLGSPCSNSICAAASKAKPISVQPPYWKFAIWRRMASRSAAVPTGVKGITVSSVPENSTIPIRELRVSIMSMKSCAASSAVRSLSDVRIEPDVSIMRIASIPSAGVIAPRTGRTGKKAATSTAAIIKSRPFLTQFIIRKNPFVHRG